MSTQRATLLRVAARGFRWIESTLASLIPSQWKKNPFGWRERIVLGWELSRRRVLNTDEKAYEVSAVIYSEACKRMLIPLLKGILRRPETKARKVRVNAIVKKRLSREVLDQLRAAGCHVTKNSFSLTRACARPEGKLALLCLDHRLLYKPHKLGVDLADRLRKHSVRTVSIQHGGTREDSVRGLASAASDVVLVWGKRTLTELVQKYNAEEHRFRMVGNPLHDVLQSVDRDQTIETLAKRFPNLRAQLSSKQIILLATCLHTEYNEFTDAQEKYSQYVSHAYDSLDFSKTILIVKMHPVDRTKRNLYQQLIPEHLAESIFIVEPAINDLDIYSLLNVADLVITRASTVAEEALLLGKKVIAFDLTETGPSKYYKHLESYENYRTVYASPAAALKEAVADKLNSSSNSHHQHDALLEEELTYSLDGRSTDRAVDEIFRQLFA